MVTGESTGTLATEMASQGLQLCVRLDARLRWGTGVRHAVPDGAAIRDGCIGAMGGAHARLGTAHALPANAVGWWGERVVVCKGKDTTQVQGEEGRTHKTQTGLAKEQWHAVAKARVLRWQG